jgi:hypothetical protein
MADAIWHGVSYVLRGFLASTSWLTFFDGVVLKLIVDTDVGYADCDNVLQGNESCCKEEAWLYE